MGRATRSLRPTILALGLFLGATVLCAQTNVSGTIAANTTWTVAGSPYVVTGNVYVEGASTPVLTIQAGVTVKFNAGTKLVIGQNAAGSLSAIGTSGSPIVFTANTGTPTAGYWVGIWFLTNAAATSNLSWATVSYAGLSGSNGGIHVNGSSPTISNVTVQNNLLAGMTLFGGSASLSGCTATANPVGLWLSGSYSGTVSGSTITANTGTGVWVVTPATPSLTTDAITNNTGYAISQDAGVTLGTVSGLTVTGNGTNGIELRSGSTVTASATWKALGLPYVVSSGTVYVEAASTPVLTVQAGVTVKFAAGAKLMIGYNAAASLQAVGTSGSPIVFTANTGSPTAGYWVGIHFWTNAASSSNVTWATVSYGGSTGSQWGGIHVNGSSPTLSNVTCQNNAFAGITTNGGAASISASTLTANPVGFWAQGAYTGTVTGSTITANTGTGVWVATPATPSLTTDTITSNTGYAISQDAGVTLGTVSGLTVTGNGTNGIELRSGNTVTASATWKSLGVPYVVSSGTVYVEAASAPVLTVQAGVTVKFAAGAKLMIGYNTAASLQAVGTSGSPIVFTANTGSPTAGYWAGIHLWTHAAASTNLTWATVSYAGVNGVTGGIYVNGSSPTLSNVNSQNHLHSGITIAGGTATISNSTFSNSSGVGIWVSTPTLLSINTVSITGNSSYAVSIVGESSFSTAAAVTATGNGINAVEMRNSTVAASATWKSFGLPYVVTGDVLVQAAAAPVLTIEAGITVKFGSGVNFNVGTSSPGGLQAVGTSAAPIVFTANTGSPTAGYWRGIVLGTSTLSTSRFAYATVTYGGVNGSWGGVYTNGNSPSFDHVRFVTNAHSGLTVNNSASVISNCDFVGNPLGILNLSTASIVDARLSWWNDVTGPSGSGPGIGQSVSAGVRFEPWLAAAESAPQYFTALTVGNSTFNPTIGVNATLTFTTPASGNWTMTITNSVGTIVRTITGTGASGAPSWNGKNDAAVDQPDGTYTYQLASVAGSGTAAPGRGRAIMDRTKQLLVTGQTQTPPFFSPNGDAVQDTTTLTATASFDGATWSVRVLNAGSTVVRTSSGTAIPSLSFTWDGKNGSGVVQPEGAYTVELTVLDGTSSSVTNTTATIDLTNPVATVTAPAVGATLSNIYQSGSLNVNVVGTATDTNFGTWTVDYGAGTSPTTWTVAGTGTTAVSANTFTAWQTYGLTNGTYTLRLSVVDLAGNKTVTTRTETIGNLTASQNVFQFNGSTGGTITYTSIVPFTLTETLVIKNAAGTTVRTIFSGSRNAGTYNDVWDGKNGSGVLLPDGPYFYVATGTAGSSTGSWDLTNVMVNDGSSLYIDGFFGSPPVFQPFNNTPLLFTYTLNFAGRASLLFLPTSSGVYPNELFQATKAMCALPGYFCAPNDEYQASGTHTVRFVGTDPAFQYRTDIIATILMVDRVTLPKNAVVLLGTAPVITNLTMTPPFYGPTLGPQTVDFDLTSYQNQAVNVTVTFRNLGSSSVLRTVTGSGLVPPHVTLTWDGKADNGTWCASGSYLVTITVTDSLGNATSATTMTTVQL